MKDLSGLPFSVRQHIRLLSPCLLTGEKTEDGYAFALQPSGKEQRIDGWGSACDQQIQVQTHVFVHGRSLCPTRHLIYGHHITLTPEKPRHPSAPLCPACCKASEQGLNETLTALKEEAYFQRMLTRQQEQASQQAERDAKYAKREARLAGRDAQRAAEKLADARARTVRKKPATKLQALQQKALSVRQVKAAEQRQFREQQAKINLEHQQRLAAGLLPRQRFAELTDEEQLRYISRDDLLRRAGLHPYDLSNAGVRPQMRCPDTQTLYYDRAAVEDLSRQLGR